MTDERPPILTGRPWPGFPCAERTGLPRLRYNPFPLSAKQSAFLLYDGPEAMLGGSGGGGKSVALLAGALQFSDVPGYNAVIFRRSLTDLTLPDGLIDVSHDWLDETDAAWNGNKYRWTFPSGAVLQFAYMKSWGSERRYKSTQFQFCVERSTKIRMGDGTLKQIDAIRPGDVVATLQGPRRVLRSFHVGLKESVRLTTEWGSVVASSTHDLMLTNGTWASPKALGPTRHHSSWSRFGELWPRRSAPVERDWRSPLGPGRGRSLVRAARGEGRLPVTVSLSGDDRTAAGGFRGSLPAEARLQAWSVPEGPPSRLLQSMGSGIVHACLAHEAPRAPLGGGVSGCLDGCASGCGRCGGPLRPAPAVVPPCTPSPDGAGGLSPGRPSGDDRDCIRPRSHGETRYAHPYTMLPELAEVPFDAGTGTRMAPVGASDLWDIQVEGASHYISESGLVHRNCGFDETTEFPWEDQVLYLFSRMRTGVSSAEEAAEVYGTAPDGLTLYDVPLRLRSATNPGGPGHCVPYGDVLTPDGWVDIASMAVGDPVFQVASDGTLEATEVRQVHRHRADEIVKVEARGLHMVMTPEHRVAKVGGTRLNRGAHHSLVPWKDLPGQATVLRTVDWVGIRSGPVEVPRRRGRVRQPASLTEVQYATFLGWFLSEGYLVDRDSAIGISQQKPDTRAKLGAFLDECGFAYSTTPSGFVLYAADWYDHLRSHEFGLSRDKYVPRRILDAPREVLAAFVEAAMYGDGHRESPTSGTYYTISERLADDVAEALVKLGYLVYTSKHQRDDRDGPCYQVNFKVTKSGGTEVLTGQHSYDVQTSTARRSDVEWLKLDAPTYCIGVDSHAFVLRQGGSVWVSGNSWTYRRYVDKTNPDRQPFLPATLDDNPGINKEEYRRMLAKLPEVERQRMEEGNWDVIEIPGALWRFADIHHVEQIRVPPPVDVGVRVLALDPAVTADGDECGIVVGSLTAGEVTVEEDLSGQMHPDDWARLAVQTYHALGCTRVVCEDNQGGELVGSALRNAADALNLDRPHVVRVRATVSKEARAIPVAQAYRAGKVHHSSLLRSGSLEAQLTSWAPGISRESPDRLDAVVWLVRHLLFAEGDAVEYHNSSARQKLGTPSTGPVTRSAATALRAGSGGPRRPGRL